MKRQNTTLKKTAIVTEGKLKTAIKDSYGNITFISKRLKVHRSTVYQSLEKFELFGLIEDERERILDLAESKLLTNIRLGKEVSILFCLKCLGKKRGWIEKNQIDVNNINPNITFIENITE